MLVIFQTLKGVLLSYFRLIPGEGDEAFTLKNSKLLFFVGIKVPVLQSHMGQVSWLYRPKLSL